MVSGVRVPPSAPFNILKINNLYFLLHDRELGFLENCGIIVYKQEILA